ncbi:hypothetical protein C0J52_15947 [Blattella germanica]|nr:hypothetical protein C0J52_15947 [Blattella germanica]
MDNNFQQKQYVTTFIITGPIVHAESISSLTIIEQGLVAVVRGRIVQVNKNWEKLQKIQHIYGIDEENVYRLKKGEFLMPGFIDTHFHAPQYPNVGLGYDKTLKQWLPEYTFPLENNFSDLDFASKVYESVVRRTLDNGTTTVSYFESIFYDSSLMLVDIVERFGQRAFIGKVNMNVFNGTRYIEETYHSLQYTELFIKFMQNKQTILAHGVYLNNEDLKILAEKKSSISHCPNSNTTLKSGLCDVRRLLNAGIKVGLGTALSIEDKTGNFKVGKDFDAFIVNLNNPGPIDLLEEITTKEMVEKFIFSGDDRNISKVFVAGRQVK